MMNKALLCLVGLILCSFSLSAQKKDRIENIPSKDVDKIHFGFYLGLNKKNFKISYTLADSYVEVEDNFGFNVGLVAGYNISDNLNLRFEPGLSSNTKTLRFTNVNTLSDNVREVPGTYFRIPMLLQYRTDRLDNMRAFIIGGVSYDYNFSSNQDNTDDNTQGQFRMKKNNFMYEFGLGVDFYLPKFKFSPSLRGVFAINNELVPDNIPSSPYTLPIDYLGTRGVFLKFTFE
ncbi:PorT family protein [Flavobacteriaceae bacterium F08102]|nr:PorT family protein [Flavobacteriaceae bacterium F08102]